MYIKNIELLIDDLQNNPKDFNMLSFDTCIVGRALRLKHGHNNVSYNFAEAQDFLGLDEKQTKIFFPTDSNNRLINKSSDTCIYVLKNLIITGIVDWNFPKNNY